MRFAVVALLLIVPHALAQDYAITVLDVDFDVRDDFSVRETMRIVLNETVEGALPFTLNDAVQDIDVEGGTYQLLDNARTLSITSRGPAFSAAFTTDRLVFQSGPVRHLFTELTFDKPVARMHATVRLPAGYGLYSEQYKPDNATLRSDGKRIILEWEKPGDEPMLFSVTFIESQSGNLWLAAALLVLGVSVLGYLHLRSKAEREFLRGFRIDEKRVVAYLQEKRVALQSDVQKEFHFSRSKTMRIVMELEAKGLVRKERRGRTNRLYWTK